MKRTAAGMVGNGISRRLGRTSHGGGGNIGDWISSRMSHGWSLVNSRVGRLSGNRYMMLLLRKKASSTYLSNPLGDIYRLGIRTQNPLDILRSGR